MPSGKIKVPGSKGFLVEVMGRRFLNRRQIKRIWQKNKRLGSRVVRLLVIGSLNQHNRSLGALLLVFFLRLI